jgi:hypothetical protein
MIYNPQIGIDLLMRLESTLLAPQTRKNKFAES